MGGGTIWVEVALLFSSWEEDEDDDDDDDDDEDEPKVDGVVPQDGHLSPALRFLTR